MLTSLAVLAIFAVGTVSSAATFKAAELRCENLANPSCVDRTTPRLSWRTEASAPNWRQTGYRIVVATTEENLRNDIGDLWDSGKVGSPDSVGIIYKGKPLAANARCFWKVQTWDATGRPSGWSKAAKWDMGLLAPSDWGASMWIGNGVAGPAPYLRRDFQSRGPVRRARLFASGLGYAELRINGKLLTGGKKVEREPGYTNFDKRVLYIGTDIAPYLKSGANTLGLVLGTGWYDVHDVATWHFENAPWRGRPRARVLLMIEYKDGTSEQVVSDSSWKVTTGPILTDGSYTGETYDARKELGACSEPGYDDSKWSAAQVMEAPKGKLAARPCPPVVIGETIKPIAIHEPQPGVYIVDFGQNFSGHASLNLSAPAELRCGCDTANGWIRTG